MLKNHFRQPCLLTSHALIKPAVDMPLQLPHRPAPAQGLGMVELPGLIQAATAGKKDIMGPGKWESGHQVTWKQRPQQAR